MIIINCQTQKVLCRAMLEQDEDYTKNKDSISVKQILEVEQIKYEKLVEKKTKFLNRLQENFPGLIDVEVCPSREFSYNDFFLIFTISKELQEEYKLPSNKLKIICYKGYYYCFISEGKIERLTKELIISNVDDFDDLCNYWIRHRYAKETCAYNLSGEFLVTTACDKLRISLKPPLLNKHQERFILQYYYSQQKQKGKKSIEQDSKIYELDTNVKKGISLLTQKKNPNIIDPISQLLSHILINRDYVRRHLAEEIDKHFSR